MYGFAHGLKGSCVRELQHHPALITTAKQWLQEDKAVTNAHTHTNIHTYVYIYIHFPICMPASTQWWICFLQMALSNQNSIQLLHSHSIFFLTVFMAWALTISLMWCIVYRASVEVCTMCVGGRAHRHSLLINIPKPLQTASQTGVSNCLPCVYTKGSFHTQWAFLIGRYVPILIGRYVPILIYR